ETSLHQVRIAGDHPSQYKEPGEVRILVVEDEPDAARMLAKGLRERSYAVDIAVDGRAALTLASDNEYDLVILDVLLPGMNGFGVCKLLRADGYSAPILMLTARDGVDDRVAGLDAGADDYLAKPFHFNELLARVRALLRRREALTPALVTIADLTIDTRTRRVSRAGKSISLTAKEYALLDYLATRLDEVVNRTDIAEHVWDETFDPFSNLIEVYIQRLRRKIDDPYGSKLIRTQRGVGYSLTAGEMADTDD
ncbi:MAG TPA: response regulator, partial [Vicinamibacterales bacterium]